MDERGWIPRRYLYACAGALLSLGAPLGLLGLRLWRGGALSLDRLGGELRDDPLTYVYLTLSTALVFGVFGHVLGSSADRLLMLSETDPLTGLGNARVLRHALERAFARAARRGRALSLLLVDLDGLKELNDRHGHDAGDAALKVVADAIRRGSRGTDVTARRGGDEFALVASGTDGAAALALAERIRALVALWPGEGGCPGVTVSIGVASAEPRLDGGSVAALMLAADRALYEAKLAGRNRVAAAGGRGLK